MVPYVDHPDLKINEHESTEMPFRYVKGDDGKPVMPEVSHGNIILRVSEMPSRFLNFLALDSLGSQFVIPIALPLRQS